jgi:uncharacterized protein YjbI with pentapeptide repeats
MANPEHVELVKQGGEAIRRWREAHPGEWLDLSEADLAGITLQRHEVLGGVNLGRVHLKGANLCEADLRGVKLQDAIDLRKAVLLKANLAGVRLFKADLSKAALAGANLTGADLSEADLSEADLNGADLSEAILGGTILYKMSGAQDAYGLETVRFNPDSDTQSSGPRNDARYFEWCHRPWPERWLDWERLRGLGRLPLFGVSYTVLILIPIVFYRLAVYNDKIELIRTWAAQVVALHDHPLHRLASLILERLHPRPIPNLSFLLLLSTVLLAAASTLYTAFCPSRIKEFSRDQWCDQFGRSLLHYWPLAWKYRYIRLACATCYALGGAGALWVLGTKIWHTALFILRYSAFPWTWR